MSTLRADLAEIRRALSLLIEPGAVHELRAPNTRSDGTVSGYFDDPDRLARSASHVRGAHGVYITLNPVRQDLLARANNRALPFMRDLTKDDDVIRRALLLIDLDSGKPRPAGTSATDQEKDFALAVMREVLVFLRARGWPEPIVADSGNGGHLAYRIALPNDQPSRDLLQLILEVLAAKFNCVRDGIEIKVDRTVFNASRIFKLYGTVSAKGDSTDQRPHRLSRILEAPEKLEPVPLELLQTLALEAPAHKKAPQQEQRAKRGDETKSRFPKREFSLEEFISRHGIRIHHGPVNDSGSDKWVLDECPFNPEHKAPDSALFRKPGGAIAFKCFHDSCAENKWEQFRLFFEPDAYSGGRTAGGPFRTAHPAHPAENADPVGSNGSDWAPEGDYEEDLSPDDVKAAVADAIARKSLDDAFLLIPEISKLPTLKMLEVKRALEDAFGRKFKVKDFERLIREERSRAFAGLPSEGTSLPVIVVNNRPLRDIVRASLHALRAANDPPVLFVRSGEMVMVDYDERERPSIKAVSKSHLRGRLDRAANYIRRGSDTQIAVSPPLDVVEDILALPSSEWAFPPLEFVVEAPTLRPDGTILSRPGYDPQSRFLYRPAPGFLMDDIPERVEADDLDVAIALIDEAICDFPYADHKDENGAVLADNPNRANLFGLLLTPVVRPAIAGCVPLALIDAPQAGTGKSLLVDLFSIVTTGRAAAMMPYPRNEDEMQKSIGSTLLAGRSLVCFDNIEGILQSPTLALVLTAKEYEARILGVSQNMVAPNRATWVATGNNIRPSGDMPRRCYHIRLDAKKSRPYQGRTFRHENLLDWARENRAKLLRALLIIARAWYQRKDKPAMKSPWGSFEDWHRAVGGILRAAGIDGFLGNLESFLAEADDMAVQWEAFLIELGELFGSRYFKVSEPLKELRESTALNPARFTLPDSLADVDRKKEGGLERALGKSFAKRIGTRFGENEVYIDRRIDKHTHQAEWRVMKGDGEFPAPIV